MHSFANGLILALLWVGSCAATVDDLISAVLEKDVDCVDILLSKGMIDVNAVSSQGQLALQVACLNKDVDMANRLIDKGAAAYLVPYKEMTLFGIVSRKSTLKERDDWTEFESSCFHGHVKKIQAYLEGGIKVNQVDALGWSCLHIASWCGHSELVSLLLAKGAAVDPSDRNGWTPLALASWAEQEGIVHILLEWAAHQIEYETVRVEDAPTTELQGKK
jgi:ankyrin repeat protein